MNVGRLFIDAEIISISNAIDLSLKALKALNTTAPWLMLGSEACTIFFRCSNVYNQMEQVQ
jgi:hypothetical protein